MRKPKQEIKRVILPLILVVISFLIILFFGHGEIPLYFSAIAKVSLGILVAHFSRQLLFPYWDLGEIYKRAESTDNSIKVLIYKSTAIFLGLYYAAVIIALALAL